MLLTPAIDTGSFELQRPGRAASFMLARLTLETQAQHRAIDEALFAPLAPPTVGSYRHFLARLYGFEAPLGCTLASTPGVDMSFVVPRMRAGWIAADLMALGITPAESAILRRRHPIPAFADRAEALGWLYVVERATLRHASLRRRIQAALPATLVNAGSYLSACRISAHQMWNELGATLDRTAQTVVIAEQIVTAAKAALASQRAWLEATTWDGF